MNNKIEAQELINDCGAYFDASESISDLMAVLRTREELRWKITE